MEAFFGTDFVGYLPTVFDAFLSNRYFMNVVNVLANLLGDLFYHDCGYLCFTISLTNQ